MKPAFSIISLLSLVSLLICFSSILIIINNDGVVSALRIGILTIEESGHLLPMTSIAHEAVTKSGHEIDVWLPDHAIKSTKPLWPQDETRVRFYESVVEDERFTADHEDNYTLYQTLTEVDALTSLGMVNEKGEYFYRIMTPLFKDTLEKTYCGPNAVTSPPDVLIADYSKSHMVLALHHSVPCLRKVPLVWLWPLTLSFPHTSMSYIPALASGFTLEELARNPINRLTNYALQRLLIWAQRGSHQNSVKELMVIAGAFGGDAQKIEDYLVNEAKFDPVNDILVNHFVITPSVFGLDLAQPLCPNIRPVGFLNPPAVADSMLIAKSNSKSEEKTNNKQEDLIPKEWRTWMEETCGNNNANNNNKRPNILYVNMGSVAILPTEWLHGMERTLRYVSEKENICVVWKMRTREQKRMLQVPEHLKTLSDDTMSEVRSGAIDLPSEDDDASDASSNKNNKKKKKSSSKKEQSTAILSSLSSSSNDPKKYLTTPRPGERFAVVARIPFAPKILLSSINSKTGRKNAAAFVSHCGDTSVYESLEALTPVVGVPLFADQPDMCARIVDAGIGVSIDKRKLSLPNSSASASASASASSKSDEDESIIRDSPLYKGIKTVVDDRTEDEETRATSMVSKMGYIKRVGESMGGAAEAVRVLELATLHGGETIKHFTCPTITTNLPWYLRDNWDICVQLAFIVLPFVWVLKKVLGLLIAILKFVSGSGSNKKKKEKKE